MCKINITSIPPLPSERRRYTFVVKSNYQANGYVVKQDMTSLHLDLLQIMKIQLLWTNLTIGYCSIKTAKIIQ